MAERATSSLSFLGATVFKPRLWRICKNPYCILLPSSYGSYVLHKAVFVTSTSGILLASQAAFSFYKLLSLVIAAT